MPRSDADQELRDLQRAMSVQGTTVAGLPSGAAVAADPEAVKAWEARKTAQREAYGQFVANADIHIGNCLVFTAGMQVPLEHVIVYELEEQELVNRVATAELARRGRVFESDEEFLKANPHVARQAKALARHNERMGDPLDPRGAGAAVQDAGSKSDSDKAEDGKDGKPSAKKSTGRAATTQEG